jgi:hypothetical protein
MAGDSLPAAVKQFIVSHLASVEELEILLMLPKREKQEWTIDPIYQVILSSRPSVERALEKFTTSGFLEKSVDQSWPQLRSEGRPDGSRLSRAKNENNSPRPSDSEAQDNERRLPELAEMIDRTPVWIRSVEENFHFLSLPESLRSALEWRGLRMPTA